MSEYPPEWPEIAKCVKADAGNKCIRCGWGHDRASGHVLTVHHLDGDKANVSWWNLAALCQRCHLRIQGRVKMNRQWLFEHSEWFKPYIAGYYARQSGRDDSREAVLANLDEYLALAAMPKFEEDGKHESPIDHNRRHGARETTVGDRELLA